MQREAQLALALLARAQSAEVLCRPGGDIREQLHHNAPSGTATDGDIKVDARATCKVDSIHEAKCMFKEDEATTDRQETIDMKMKHCACFKDENIEFDGDNGLAHRRTFFEELLDYQRQRQVYLLLSSSSHCTPSEQKCTRSMHAQCESLHNVQISRSKLPGRFASQAVILIHF